MYKSVILNNIWVTLPSCLQIPTGMQPQQEATQAVQTLAEVAANHQDGGPITLTAQPTGAVSVEMNPQDGGPNTQTVATLAEATLNQDGQLVLTGDAGLAGLLRPKLSWLFCWGEAEICTSEMVRLWGASFPSHDQLV